MTDWRDLAACKGMDIGFFFPPGRTLTTEAAGACSRCPVTEQCAELGKDADFGTYGGVSARVRRMRRKAGSSAA